MKNWAGQNTKFDKYRYGYNLSPTPLSMKIFNVVLILATIAFIIYNW